MFRAGGKEKYILPVLILENIAAIRDSLLTPFGSPQNLFLFSQSGISAPSFMLMMLPLWIYVREYPGNGFKFARTFTWISLIFFAVVVLPQLWLITRL